MFRKLIFLISVVAMAGFILTSVANAADPNLIGWWKMDEGSGTTTADSAGSNNGTFGIDALGNPDSSNAPQWADGRRGENSLLFFPTDGVDFVTCGHAASLDVNGPMTVMAWIRGPLDNWTANSIVTKGDSWGLLMWSNYKVRWELELEEYLGEGGFRTVTEQQPGIYTGWHHLAGTWNGSTGGKLYYDGAVADSNFTLSGTQTHIDSVNDLCFGAKDYPGEVGREWKGYIDDVRIYNRFLSDAEILAIYNLPYDIAHDPSPADRAETGVAFDGKVTMTWVASANAVSHDVYFGTANPPPFIQNQAGTTYQASGLTPDTTYYWRIREHDGATLYMGPVWSFDLKNYIILDNFESYADTAALSAVWVPQAGMSWVMLNHTEYYQDGNSMEAQFWNKNGAKYSEVMRTYAAARDFSANNMETIAVRFMGTGGSQNAEKLYMILKDSANVSARVDHPGNPTAVQNTTKWAQWNIALSSFTGVNLTQIKYVIIGFGDKNYPVPPSADGQVSFDNLKLYPSRCIYDERPAADVAGAEGASFDCKVDNRDLAVMSEEWLATAAKPVLWYKLDETFDGNWYEGCDIVHDSSGNGHDGIINDANIFEPTLGKIDGCVDFQENDDIIVPLEALSSIENEITIAFWAYGDPDFGEGNLPTWKNKYDCAVCVKFGEGVDNKVLMFYLPEPNDWDGGSSGNKVTVQSGNPDTIGVDEIEVTWQDGWYRNGWHHYAYTKNVDDEQAVLYIDGDPCMYAVNPTRPIYGATGFLLGNRGDLEGGGSHFFMWGYLDDFRMYNYSLSATDVNGLSKYPQVEPKPRPDFNLSGRVNFNDFATLGTSWLEEVLFP